MTANEGLRDIVEFHVGLTDDWHPMPLAGADAAEWAGSLAETLATEPEHVASLADDLRHARQNLESMSNPRMTAAVWVPYPDSGRASAAIVFELTDLKPGDGPESFEKLLQSYETYQEPGLSYYSVQTWRGSVDAGELVGSHNLIAHAGEDPQMATLEERVVVGVFPAGAAQFVQFICSAESLGSFTNAPQQVQDFVATLTVRLEDAA